MFENNNEKKTEISFYEPPGINLEETGGFFIKVKSAELDNIWELSQFVKFLVGVYFVKDVAVIPDAHRVRYPMYEDTVSPSTPKKGKLSKVCMSLFELNILPQSHLKITFNLDTMRNPIPESIYKSEADDPEQMESYVITTIKVGDVDFIRGSMTKIVNFELVIFSKAIQYWFSSLEKTYQSGGEVNMFAFALSKAIKQFIINSFRG